MKDLGELMIDAAWARGMSRGLRVHQLIEDEAAYLNREADRVLVDGEVVRERVHGDFWTRDRVQWVRWAAKLVRQFVRIGDWWYATREATSERFWSDERRRHCPHRQEWRHHYPDNIVRCEGCGDTWVER